MNRRTNRRQFLKNTAIAGAGFWVAGRAAWAQSRSPNEKLGVACVGGGGKGRSDIEGCASENIVAICDIDDDRAGASYQKFPKAKRYRDFRKMLEEMEKEIDAVTVSTPDHQHAVAAMMAMRMGKHVYCQKPLTHDVYEARALTEAAAKYKVVTQMGNQGTASDGFREAVEVIRGGAIGAIREIHVWTNRPVWPQGTGALLDIGGIRNALHEGKGDAEFPKPPDNLDWDLWLGTAPMRRYWPKAYHPFAWRGWWDFGCGALGDMACHTANMAFMSCNLGFPTSVEAECSEFNPETFPMWSVVRFDFPARGEQPPLKFTWYDGGNDKPAWVGRKLAELAQGQKVSDSGSLLVGDKGTLFSPNDYGAKYVLLPTGDFTGHKPPTPTLPRSPGHYKEWITAIKENKPTMPMSNFSYAGPFTETVLLGCVALRFPGRRLEWDGPSLKFTNVAEANPFVRREYRKGWEL